ncbi:unnamed protein product [Spirodela intermedia]|uniref:Uncharacterized protein n=1 Tax=Spirodela intermedia TaxID=51605 RepID=A0A7I8J7J3_SPIIN|nr:unnamed protein product [Spirodela intermedia]CAA6666177.1 unnamed protein product [Spirodela intermedia]
MISEWESPISRAQKAILSLSDVLGRPLPESVAYSENHALRLLHDAELCDEISARLRLPSSGAGDDTLAVLRFVPTIAGVYLPRAAARRPLPGYEAVLLALYAHETTARATSRELGRPRGGAGRGGHLPTLEPHGAVRATKRARIVGWRWRCTAQRSASCRHAPRSTSASSARVGREGGRIPLPWELIQPSLRILGHCLMGTSDAGEVQDKAAAAVRGLLARATLDVDTRAILATRSLLRAWEMAACSTKRWPDLDFLLEDPPSEGDATRELLPSPSLA